MTTPSDALAPGAGLPERAVRELAAVTASLVTEHDVIGTVTNLLTGCVRCLDAAGGGIVVTRLDDPQLEFLAATSHRAQDVELSQVQINEGPALDCLATGRPVAADLDQIAARWPSLVEPFRSCGYRSVYAHPMFWQSQTLGAVNIFFASNTHPDTIAPIVQAFADMATIAIVHAGAVSTTQVISQLRGALSGRVVIEQAKGVFAHTQGTNLDTAFDRLLQLAHRQQRPLSEIAAEVIAAEVNTR